jgi:large subunit ribosomal protein L25
MGGVMNVTRRTLPVRTTPAKIPVSVDVDVTSMQLHDTISVEDVELPEGVECTLSPKLTLVLVLEPRRVAASADDEEAEGGESAAAAEGEAPQSDS